MQKMYCDECGGMINDLEDFRLDVSLRLQDKKHHNPRLYYPYTIQDVTFCSKECTLKHVGRMLDYARKEGGLPNLGIMEQEGFGRDDGKNLTSEV